MDKPHEPIVVGFMGISHPHSSARWRSAAQVPGVTIAGAYDEDAAVLAAFCDEVGARSLDASEVLEDPRIKAIFVHPKSNRMSSYALEGIEAGKHVLVEKPGGATLDDLRSLALASIETGPVVRVGYNFHFSPALEQARSILASGGIGRASLVRGHGACSTAEHLSAHLNQPFDMGGGLWVIGCHVLHLMLDLLGPPVEVRATVSKFGAFSDSNSQEDVASLTMLFEDKIATYDFTVQENCEWFETSVVEVYGDKGHLSFGVLPGRIEALLLDPKDRPAGRSGWNEGLFTTPWSGHKSTYSELSQVGNKFFFDREVVEFLSAARGQATTGGVTALTAYHVAAVISAAYQSSARGGLGVPVAVVPRTR